MLNEKTLTIHEGERQTTVELPQYFQPLALSPDGQLLAGQVDDNLIIWSLKTGQRHAWVSQTTGGAVAAWSPDGSQLAIWTGNLLKLADAAGKAEPRFSHAGTVTDLQWSPDGHSLLVGFGRGAMGVWLIDPGPYASPVKELEREVAQSQYAPRLSPDGSQVVAIAYLGNDMAALVRISATEKPQSIIDTGRLTAALPHLADLFEQHRFLPVWHGWSPTGQRIAVTFKAYGQDPYFGIATVLPDGSDLHVLILPKYPDHPENQFHHPRRPCSPESTLWTPDGRHLIVRLAGPGCDGHVAIYEAAPLRQVQELKVAPGPTLALSPDGQWLAAESHAGELTLFPLARPDQQTQLNGKLLAWLK